MPDPESGYWGFEGPDGLDPFDYTSPGDADQAILSEVMAAQDPEAGMYYDPATGSYIATPREGAVAAPSPAAFRSASDQIRSNPVLSQLEIDPSTGVITYPDGTVVDPSSHPDVWQQIKNTFNASGVGSFLNSIAGGNLGRALVQLGLGAAGLGLGRAVAGSGGALTLPPFESGANPVLSAGQRAAANIMSKEGTQATLEGTIGSTLRGYSDLASRLENEIGHQAEDYGKTYYRSRDIREGALNALPGFTTPDAEGTALTDRIARLRPLINANLSATPEGTDPLLADVRTGARRLLSEGADAFAVPDEVEGAIRERLLRAIRGEEVDPALERRITEGREIMLNRLKQMYGRAGQDVEGTVGGGLTQEYDKRANELRYGVNRDVMGLLSPEERVRRQFSINNPKELYLRNAAFLLPEERARTSEATNRILAERGSLLGAEAGARGARSAGLGEKVALTNFGQRSLGDLATGLSSILTVPPLLGLNDESGRIARDTLRANAASAAFQADRAARNDLAKGIATIGGRTADAFTARTPINVFSNVSPGGY